MDKYTLEKIKKYWLKDLTNKEIGLLVGLSERTIKRAIKSLGLQNMSRAKSLAVRAFELKQKGFSYTTIAQMLGVSKTTVYNYVKGNKETAAPNA